MQHRSENNYAEWKKSKKKNTYSMTLFTYNFKKCKLIETKIINCWGTDGLSWSMRPLVTIL